MACIKDVESMFEVRWTFKTNMGPFKNDVTPETLNVTLCHR